MDRYESSRNLQQFVFLISYIVFYAKLIICRQTCSWLARLFSISVISAKICESLKYCPSHSIFRSYLFSENFITKIFVKTTPNMGIVDFVNE
jgi:hypothetical protein